MSHHQNGDALVSRGSPRRTAFLLQYPTPSEKSSNISGFPAFSASHCTCVLTIVRSTHTCSGKQRRQGNRRCWMISLREWDTAGGMPFFVENLVKQEHLHFDDATW